MNTRTQKEQVLSWLRNRGSLTVMTGFKRLGVTRLSERIRELEADGHLVNRAWVQRHGKRFVAYSLVNGRRRAA